MEQHESFAHLMARRKKLAAAGTSTSSTAPQTASPAATIPPASTKSTVKITDNSELTTDVKPSDPAVGKTK